jgi:hypothetical protein
MAQAGGSSNARSSHTSLANRESTAFYAVDHVFSAPLARPLSWMAHGGHRDWLLEKSKKSASN